jgi:Carboxypeptidase regulatory-like domain
MRGIVREYSLVSADTARGPIYSASRVFVCLFLLTFSIAQVQAQNIQGSITGLVRDPSGAVVPAAKVSAVSQDTGVRYAATATAAGVYVIPQVPEGRYTVTVEAPGFKTFVKTDQEVNAGEPLRVDAALELGSATQRVTVSGRAPLVQAENATLGGNFTKRQFEQLPIGANGELNILSLVPGSVPLNNGYATGVFNGGLYQTTDYKVDGTPSTLTTTGATMGNGPIEEMVGEVVLQNSNYSAEYGRGSAQVSENTIAGTNQYHGTLFEYVENEALNANSFFNNLHGAPRPRSRNNIFGATIGGPVIIPHLYNGHDRTFFTFGYQGTRSTPAASYTSTVPTEAMRNGDFTGFPTIYDPATTKQSANGSYTRTAFAGNMIPTSRMDPVALRLLANSYPLPNLPGTRNNYFVSGIGHLSNTTFQGRLDQNFSEKNRLTFRMLTFYQSAVNFDRWPGPSGVQSSTAVQNSDEYNTSESVEHTYVIRPNLVNVAKFGYYYFRWFKFGPGTNEDWAGKVGLKGAGPEEFPHVSISQLTAFGGSALADQFPAKNLSFDDTLLMVKGRHSVKFGFEYRHLDNQFYSPGGAPSGSFTFDTSPTDNPANGKLGSAFASFLLGIPTDSSLSVYPPPTSRFNVHWPYYAAYVQDDFRVSKKLTLNLGLRWEINTPYKESHNYMSSFNLATGQLDYAGLNGYPDTLFDAYYKGFAPRLGFAYSPFGNNKTVIRGGFGIFNLPNASIGGSPFTGVGPWAQNFSFPSTDKIADFPITLQEGFPTVTLGQFPVISPALSVSTNTRSVIPPYMEMWNLNVQREIGSATMVQVGYAGTAGHHLMSNMTYNTVPPNLLGPGNAQLKRPYPNVGNIREGPGGAGLGNSSYHALQVLVEHRLQRGFSARVAYTFSKSLDDLEGSLGTGSGSFSAAPIQNYYDLAAEKSPSNFNIPHILNWSFVWQLPVGRGRAFLNRGGWVNALIGGWNLSSLSSLHSGTPLAMGTTQNQTGSEGGGSRPNRLGKPTLPGSQRSLDEWFNTAMFVLPAQFSYGNDSRTEPQVYGPGEFDMAFLLSKQLHFTERWWAEVRCQANNAFNHFNPGNPNTSVGNPAFGTITGGGGGRSMILSVRLHF